MIVSRVIDIICTIKTTDRYILDVVLKQNVFTGCQCFKDCSCKDDFKQEQWKCFRIKKFKLNDPGYMKTKYFHDINDAKKYCITLIKTKYEHLKH